MTANEMKYEFELKFDSLFDYSAPAYDDRQVSYLLTNAQLRIFKDHYNPLANKYRAGFEQNEQRRRDLEQLINSASISGGDISTSSSQIGVHPNGTFYDLPDDFYLAIEENAVLTGSSIEINVLPVQHDWYRNNVRNPYKQPWDDLVWRMDFRREDHGEDGGDSYTGRTAKRVELITDGTAITDYRVRYIQTPPEIVVATAIPANQRHCILDETLHEEIVAEACKIADAAVKKEEYQISTLEARDTE